MRLRFLSGVLSLVLLSACATRGDVVALESQITALQQEVAALSNRASSKDELQSLNETLGKQTQSILKSNADVAAKVGEFDDRLQNVQGTVEQTNYRIDRIAQQLTQAQKDIENLKGATARATAAAAAAAQAASQAAQPETVQDELNVQAPAGSGDDPLEVYQAAYRDYRRGTYDLAIDGFKDFLKKSPNSDLADNAAYWLGESFYSQKKYPQAIEQFDRVVNAYKTSDKVPGALLKKGLAYLESGQKAQGIVQLQYVIHEHPRSQEASLARERLKSLGVK